ncbi:MAG: putative 2OG-Fe(II) oxygenase [Myxococcota bacterium]|nr:putative 2OG-Fe(II) oxygenase [Myxococcota bacterium]
MQNDDSSQVISVQAIGAQEPSKQPTMLYPFGPAIFRTRMSDSMVKELNAAIDWVKSDLQASEMLDWSDQLVGKVEQEVIIPKPAFQPHLSWLAQQVRMYVHTAFQRVGKNDLSPLEVRFVSWWAVRTLAGDFNPVHFHTDCDLSMVGYLAVPDWEEELAEDAMDHYPCKGYIEFLDGRPQLFSNHRIKFRPQIGDLYIFPSWIQHTVYPFHKSEGERRSFSANIRVSEQASE